MHLAPSIGARRPRQRHLAVLLSLAGAATLWFQQAQAVAAVPRTPFGSHLPGDYFGSAVGVSGTIAVGGAPGAASTSGAAYVFARANGVWRQQAKLIDPGRAALDYFGTSVGVSGQTVVVGAPGAQNSAGAAYIFVRSAGSWRRQAVLTDPRGVTNDYFGFSVALSGSTAIVGAYGVNRNSFGGNNAGAVYIYERSGATWHLQASFTDPGYRAGDEFGISVAISNSTALVASTGVKQGAGAAYVYARPAATWRQQARIADPVGRADDFFGASVALVGTTAVIGAPGAKGIAGVAYIYQNPGGGWRKKARLADPGGSSNDWFGSAVAVSATSDGLRVIVGDPNSDTRRCGTAYDFFRPAGTWRERAKIANPGCARRDWFGNATALSGRTALIGALGKDNNAGAVYQLTIP